MMHYYACTGGTRALSHTCNASVRIRRICVLLLMGLLVVARSMWWCWAANSSPHWPMLLMLMHVYTNALAPMVRVWWRSYQIINKWICINFRLIVFHKSKWIMSEYGGRWTRTRGECVRSDSQSRIVFIRLCREILVVDSLHEQGPPILWGIEYHVYRFPLPTHFLSIRIFVIINWIRNRIENVNYLKCHHGSSTGTPWTGLSKQFPNAYAPGHCQRSTNRKIIADELGHWAHTHGRWTHDKNQNNGSWK